jgi:uncharacterized protein (TIGR00251 family)
MIETREGTIIKAIVKPKSKGFKIKPEEDNLLVFCRNVPEKGKVNKELINDLSKLLKREVAIISGFTAKEKIILIKDTKPEELELLLSKAPNS